MTEEGAGCSLVRAGLVRIVYSLTKDPQLLNSKSINLLLGRIETVGQATTTYEQETANQIPGIGTGTNQIPEMRTGTNQVVGSGAREGRCCRNG